MLVSTLTTPQTQTYSTLPAVEYGAPRAPFIENNKFLNEFSYILGGFYYSHIITSRIIIGALGAPYATLRLFNFNLDQPTPNPHPLSTHQTPF